MGWQDLLGSKISEKDSQIVLPWVGGRSLRLREQVWKLKGPLPPEHGWWTFLLKTNRMAFFGNSRSDCKSGLQDVVKGYLVGDRLVPDGVGVDPSPEVIVSATETVHIIEQGLDRFVRVAAGRLFDDGPLIYLNQEFPQGPEEEVLDAFLNKKASVAHIKGVTPALDAAFRMEVHQRTEAEKRRAEAEKRRREEEERLAKEERRRQIAEELGDGAGRRRLAAEDFGEAAKAALAVGNAEYLDHRQATRKHEMVVRFRVGERRFECTCDATTMQIIDAGICLTAHHDDAYFKHGTKGDTFFTLESLPSVIREAEADHKLVVYRHVDDYGEEDDE
jgi:hypothetical protein